MSGTSVLYVSGPMSGIEEFNWPAFREATRRLRDAGYVVCCPTESGATTEGMTWEECLRRSLKLMLDADALAMLPGWESSRGAIVERDLAFELRMVVRPLDYWLDLETISHRREVGLLSPERETSRG